MSFHPGGLFLQEDGIFYVDQHGVKHEFATKDELEEKGSASALLIAGAAATQLKRPVSRRSLLFPWRKR